MKLLRVSAIKWVLIASLVAVPTFGKPSQAAANGGSLDTLVLKKNSSVMLHNGQSVQAVQPVTFKNGSSYAPFKSIARVYGFTVSYEARTKESIARNGDLEIRFTPNSSNIKVNGEIVKSPGPVFIQKGFMMIPMRTWSNLTGSGLRLNNSEITFTWNATTEPKADFKVVPEEIYAGQTRVTYEDLSTGAGGSKIVEVHWEGKQEYFNEPGTYVITRQVMDESGTWSEPFSVTIQVREPNQAPVASFKTDKTQYRIGETIVYTDTSTDDEDAIVKRKWEGNDPVFFAAGHYNVKLEVEDRHGRKGIINQIITVTDEVLYTEEEYNLLFTPVGDKYPINASSVLRMEPVPYNVIPEQLVLVHSNSPETLLGEGIAYEDTLSGDIRFLFHNANATNKNLNLYVVATNTNETTASVGLNAFGIGGPNTYVSTGGKLAASRFMHTLANPSDTQWTSLLPGESKIIMPELSRVPIKPGQVVSAYGDVYADMNVRFQVVVIDQALDPIASLPGLKPLDRDNKHVRGTFSGGNRSLEISGILGEKPQRIALGDRMMDQYLEGVDMITGYRELNIGNFGVLYKLTVDVAPRTLIALNPRGGHYAGAFLINGKVVNTTDKSILRNSSEAGVLYRTGNSIETVEMQFVLASGSNLPIQMMFLPLPEMRQ
ncbi:copper amine oxidase N-terminal domain-containing protein [Paenibacillus abyssi]|uniref:Copper amine oxidase-like N-terminal domain-containing protein n=1 Tax=Paenibacillus abyssi TaxID=1340531 RepID=A0A917CHN6_9BACL|nr:copper amine oxidase N-terminal domain-containing protein [Paenibacillus abyssi]GGF86865.1 hypothetical protein GCM10010916_00250 [Paenibacillus abyssi]